MPFKIVDCDNVRESFSSAGPTITLGGAMQNSRALSGVLASGDTFLGVARKLGEISVGKFTYTSGAPGTVAQTEVWYSSNNNNAVTFSSGPDGEIFMDAPARLFEHLNMLEIAVASGATADIGAAQGKFIELTGGTGPVASFGTAKNKERIVRYTGPGVTITNSATLACPGATDLVLNTGDIFDAKSDNAATPVWRITPFPRAGAIAAEVLTANRTLYVRTAPVTVTVSIASPGVVTWNSHGLAANAAVVLSILPQKKAITVTIASPGVVTWTAHGFAAGQPVKFETTGALPTGITAGTTYFVIATGLTADTFQFSATVGGAAVNTSGTQSGSHFGSKTGALPTGLVEGTVYYVVAASITANTFQVSATPGGAAINTSGTQSGTISASTGSDSNTGSAQTAAAAFLTIQKAINTIAALDMSTFQVTAQIADSTYTEAAALRAYLGALPPLILGNATTPANVFVDVSIASAICFNNDAARVWRIESLKLRTTGSASYLMRALNGGDIRFTNIEFGPCASSQFVAASGGRVTATGPFAISGNARALLEISNGTAFIFLRTVTITNNPTFSQGFALADGLGMINAFSMTFIGSATGPRYAVTQNSVIFTNGGGANYFPGNAAGSVNTGGQYL